MSTITHEQLRKAAFACLRRQKSNYNRKEENVGFGCSLVVSEVVSAAYEIPDAIGWRYGSSILIECKCSRSDFFADAKKIHRLGTGVGQKRFFMTPPGLVKISELPDQWGLLEVEGRKVNIIYQPPWKDRILDTKAHTDENRILLSLISRIKAREFIHISSDQMDKELCESEALHDEPIR